MLNRQNGWKEQNEIDPSLMFVLVTLLIILTILTKKDHF